MTQDVRVVTVFGQDPAFADPENPIRVNILVRIAPNMQHAKRRPVNLVWVQDRSGSMKGEKMEQSKKVMSHLIGQLDEKDHAGIVAFNRQVSIVHDHKPMTPWNKRVAKKRVKELTADGSTQLAPALETARNMESEGTSEPRTVVMLTDGLSQCGNTKLDQDNFIALSKALAKDGGRLILIGVGPDYNHDLLSYACLYGSDHELFHVSTTDFAQLATVQEEVMAQLRSVAISQLSVVGEFKPGVNIKRITTFSPTQKDHSFKQTGMFRIQAGSLSRHRGQHLLLELNVEHPQTGLNVLGGIIVSGEMTDQHGVTKTLTSTHTLAVVCTNDPDDARKQSCDEVRNCLVKAQAFRLVEQEKYDEAKVLYDAIGDDFMVQQIRWTKEQAKLSPVKGRNARRTTTSILSRSVTRDWRTGDFSS